MCGVPFTSPKMSSTLCTDSSTIGWGVSGSRGKLEMMTILFDSPPNHPDSDRQLDLHTLPKTPGRHQGPPADIPHLDKIKLVASYRSDTLLFPYLFPPSPILPVVLQKVKQCNNTFLVISPIWPCQSWYSDLITLSLDHPLCLPQTEDLLVPDIPKKYWVHPNPGLFQYHAGLLSGSTSKHLQTFQQALPTEGPCHRETKQDNSTTQIGRNFVIGAINGRQILSQLMCL